MTDMFAQQETFSHLGQILYGLLSDGDEKVTCRVNRVGKYSELELLAIRADGELETSMGRAKRLNPPVEIAKALRDLRAASYQKGKGAWFSIRVTVTPDGSATAEYNYDSDPEWQGAIEPTIYVQEQEKFPRDLDHQPEWYRQRLAEGRVALDEWRRSQGR